MLAIVSVYANGVLPAPLLTVLHMPAIEKNLYTPKLYILQMVLPKTLSTKLVIFTVEIVLPSPIIVDQYSKYLVRRSE